MSHNKNIRIKIRQIALKSPRISKNVARLESTAPLPPISQVAQLKSASEIKSPTSSPNPTYPKVIA
jgi:hypothetical protein